MATRYKRRDTGRTRTSIRAAVALVGLYTAFYLAVAGLAHSLASPEATAAIVPDRTVAHARATTPPLSTLRAADGSSVTDLRDPEPGAPDNSLECSREAGIDAECIFN